MADAEVESDVPDGKTALRPFTYEASANFVAILNEIRRHRS